MHWPQSLTHSVCNLEIENSTEVRLDYRNLREKKEAQTHLSSSVTWEIK